MTVLGGKIGKKHRHAYDNYVCKTCGLKLSKLIKDEVPEGES
jgi:hypothetical protein